MQAIDVDIFRMTVEHLLAEIKTLRANQRTGVEAAAVALAESCVYWPTKSGGLAPDFEEDLWNTYQQAKRK